MSALAIYHSPRIETTDARDRPVLPQGVPRDCIVPHVIWR